MWELRELLHDKTYAYTCVYSIQKSKNYNWELRIIHACVQESKTLINLLMTNCCCTISSPLSVSPISTKRKCQEILLLTNNCN